MSSSLVMDAAFSNVGSLHRNRIDMDKSVSDFRSLVNFSNVPFYGSFKACLQPKQDKSFLFKFGNSESSIFNNARAISSTRKRIICQSGEIKQSENIQSDENSLFKNELLTLTTFNILAPIYKRLNGNERLRESQEKDLWLSRNEGILNLLLDKQSSVICLQEFWHDNEELLTLYSKKLGENGYELFNVPRTNGRGDGLLTAVHTKKLTVRDHREILFHDCGDRVAQILFLECNQHPVNVQKPSQRQSQSQTDCLTFSDKLQFLVVNTHLLFPHNGNSSLIRIREVYKILEYLELYRNEKKLGPLPIVLCGDWNGSKKGNVYKFLRSQGFVSSYDVAKEYSDDEVHKWVSHKNHHGNLCGVDYIWLLNPKHQNQPLTADWKAAIFSMIKAKLEEAGLTREKEAFTFFQSQEKPFDNSQAFNQEQSPPTDDYFTLKDFQYAMDKLGLTGEGTVGLTEREICDLVSCADIDGNGVIDYFEFKKLFNFDSMEQSYSKIKQATGITEQPWIVSSTPSLPPSSSSSFLLTTTTIPIISQTEEGCIAREEDEDINTNNNLSQAQNNGDVFLLSTNNSVNLKVKEAFLFPKEMEDADWPEHYVLSDHAPLTACFVLDES